MSKSKYVEPSAYKRIYGAMNYENALALRVSLETGMRIGDVLALRPEDLTGRTISYIAEKTGKPDKKIITADLSKRLRQVQNRRWIFPGRGGVKHRTRQAVWKDLKNACDILGVSAEGVSPHAARKTYAVDDFKKNGIESVQKHLQHDRLSTTMIYAFADVISNGSYDRSDGAILNADMLDVFAEKIAQRVVELIYKRNLAVPIDDVGARKRVE
jgi:integrase